MELKVTVDQSTGSSMIYGIINTRLEIETMAKDEIYPYQLVREHIQESATYKNREKIVKEFSELINAYSLESDSNTPDFILAEYLWDCLMSANILIGSRAVWYNPTAEGVFDAQDIPDNTGDAEKTGQ